MSQDPVAPQPVASESGGFKTVLTWRGIGEERLEQVRVTVTGKRIKAYGRIVDRKSVV